MAMESRDQMEELDPWNVEKATRKAPTSSAKTFAEMAKNHRIWVGEMMSGLSAREMNDLYDLLARLKESILAAEQKNNLEAAE